MGFLIFSIASLCLPFVVMHYDTTTPPLLQKGRGNIDKAIGEKYSFYKGVYFQTFTNEATGVATMVYIKRKTKPRVIVNKNGLRIAAKDFGCLYEAQNWAQSFV